jgi:alkanesulfonate monooxygenase SsuD/methylene tetrahydromethanopterin reductase-like flavin-dependent oxidoreductase (luciferase family)
MKFGFFTIIPFHESHTEAEHFQQTLERIELADQLGFTEVWLGEHHFSRHGLVSGLYSWMGAAVARTKNVRVGSAINILPFHNPILAAEEAATLDVLSGGRINFGIGSGYQRQEFDGLGVNIDEARDRFREAIDVMIQAWTQEKLTFHGQFTHVDDLWVLPKPIQQPHPPLYIAVSTSPSSVEYAASRQIQIMVGGPTDIMGQATQVVQLWHEKMEEFGHEHAHIDLPVAKRVYVAPTVEEAASDLAGHQDFTNNVMRSISTTGAPVGMPTDKDGNLPKGYESWASRQQDRERRDDVGHAGLAPLFGSPEVVIERLAAVQEQGINRIFSQFGFPGVPHKNVMRAMEMFGTKVMPHFREEPATVSS